MGRMGDPEDLSVRVSVPYPARGRALMRAQGAIVFLASDASRFMTGSEIRVDGGYCCV